MAAAEDSLAHLGEAEELATDPLRKIEILREIAYTGAANFGLLAQASDTLDKARALARDLDQDLEMRLFVERATWQAMDSGRPLTGILRELEKRGEPSGQTAAERGILALLAWTRMLRARPASEVRGPAVAALRNGQLIRELGAASLTVAAASWALANTFSRAELEPELRELRHFCARQGNRHGVGIHAFSAAVLAHIAGRLRDAEAFAKESLDSSMEVNSVGATGPLSCYLDILCDLGQFETGWRQLEALGFLGELPPFWPFTMVYLSRGLLRAHRGDPEQGLEDVMVAAKVYEQWEGISPAYGPWRHAAAQIHLQMGNREEAHQLVEEELQIALGTELPHVIGRDLRLLGCCEDGSAAVDHLREAVNVLESSEARLEHARALIELGSALRRENRRGSGPSVEEARALLRNGIDMAFQAGARPLVERGQTELRATGARPRNAVFSGPDSLTPSERRAAQMAADGMSNREIAEALFVTLKTVEKHLGNCYLKLDISGRKELGQALSQEAAA
jgi:ATP/maltotriose-dependent transcriptional regulator MalT